MKKAVIVIYLALTCPGLAFAQAWDWRISGESGYFNSSNNKNLHSLSALQGTLRYHRMEESSTWSIQLRARPEIFDDEHGMLSSSVTGFYKKSWHRWQGGFLLVGRDQKYRLPAADLDIRLYQIQGILTFNVLQRYYCEGELRRTWTESEADATNRIWANAAFFRGRYVLDHGALSIGGFTERFRAETTDLLTIPDANRGWRNGLEAKFDYTKSFLINCSYLISWRTSRWTRGRSTEHEINVLAGRSFSDRWSLFLLAEYYMRQLKRSNQISQNLLYTNTNYDNRIYLKLGYDLFINQTLYFKTSYLSNDLIQESVRLSGTNLALGYEIRR